MNVSIHNLSNTISLTAQILLHEMFTYHKRKQLQNRKLVKVFLMDVYKKWLVFVFGLMSVDLTANIFKYSVGRLRPHFFDSCRPIDPVTGLDLSNCSNVPKYAYIENYICSGENVEANLRLSFFSGHACLLSYQYVYLLLYTQNHMQLRQFGLIRPMLQTAHLVLSIFLVLSRVFDYYHHPSDLLFGSVVGTAGAVLTYYFLFEYAESYWLKSSQFLFSYDDDDQFIDSVEQVDADSEAQKIKRRPGRDVIDVVDKRRLRKSSDLVQATERTALLTGASGSHLSGHKSS